MISIAKAASYLAAVAKPLVVCTAAFSLLICHVHVHVAKAQFDDAIHNSPLLETNPDLNRKPASLLIGKYDDLTNVDDYPSSNGSYLVMGQTVYYLKNWWVLDIIAVPC